LPLKDGESSAAAWFSALPLALVPHGSQLLHSPGA